MKANASYNSQKLKTRLYLYLKSVYWRLPWSVRQSLRRWRDVYNSWLNERSQPAPVSGVAEVEVGSEEDSVLSAAANRQSLYEDIAQNFGLTIEFVQLYFEHQDIERYHQKSWREFSAALDSLQRMYIEFALTTATRGRGMVRLLDDASCIRKMGRYLDVGTGYGGFLRAFDEVGFDEVVGIELQAHLASFAEANVTGIDSAKVLNIDFEKTDCSDLAGFNLITCNDVIEHVKDPALTIKKMSELLADEGCLCLEVPNKDCISFVKSDGHFQIFGITQLAREDAATYYSQMLAVDRSGYLFEMGESYELGWYHDKLSAGGLECRNLDINLIAEIRDVPHLIADFKVAYMNWNDNVKPKLSTTTAETVTAEIQSYIAQLECDYSALADDVLIERFKDKYLRTFWTIIAAR